MRPESAPARIYTLNREPVYLQNVTLYDARSPVVNECGQKFSDNSLICDLDVCLLLDRAEKLFVSHKELWGWLGANPYC